MSNQKHYNWFDKPKNIKKILYGLYIACALLVILDCILLYTHIIGHRHIYTDIEKVPAFYAFFGCVSCIILVVVAAHMRAFVIRKENYYQNNKGVVE